jgi:hypothetical protein
MTMSLDGMSDEQRTCRELAHMSFTQLNGILHAENGILHAENGILHVENTIELCE